MILATCLNPAIDVTYRVVRWRHGEAQRVQGVHERAGGKGVNVARVLRQLDAPAMVLGFAGGRRGAELCDDLRRGGLEAELVPIASATRRTVTIVDDTSATLLSEPGPQVTPAEWHELVANFDRLVAHADAVALSGSLPPGVPTNGYAQLTERAHRSGALVLVDASGEALHQALAAHPDLVSPNATEMADLAEQHLLGETSPASLVRGGARGAVVSHGADGLRAVLEGQGLRVRMGETVLGNATGAGDALAAALVAGMLAGTEPEQLLVDAAAVAGGAVAFAYAGGFDAATADRLRSTIRVEPDDGADR